MKRILINATQQEELRVAMVNGQKLYDLDIEVPSREQKKSNIYKGKITRIEPSLEAAFVDYGAERHGFLPFKEVSRQYYGNVPKDDNGRPIIKDAIKVDQEIIVQVEKEERGNKGAALTSFISLAGRFLVAMPQNPRAGGVSRRIEGEDREAIKKIMSELEMPKDMGVIVRTAGVGRSIEEVQWDLDYLNQVWVAIEKAAEDKAAPFLIYQESNIVIRALRDHYKTDVGEILIDSEAAYKQAHEFMSMVMPNSISKLKLFQDKLPLFNRFQIESQIESAFSREVTLPSGGAIVIDHTEALTSIDVNSARATKGSDIEETAKMTNLEAAEEVARQLRIRDLGGLLVIDFIDMMQNKNQREVENRLRDSVYEDRARVQIGRISRFGLLEMSRQRLRPSLEESSQIVCPRCNGQGTIRDVESLSLAVLRLLEDESLKDSTGKILAKVPVECATYLLNEKRDKIEALEKRRQVHIIVIPDPNLETPHYELERVKDSDTHRHESNYKKSYEMGTETEEVDLISIASAPPPPTEQAAVQSVQPAMPRAMPTPSTPTGSGNGGLISRFMGLVFGNGVSSDAANEPNEEETSKNRRQQTDSSRNRRGGRNRNPQNRSRGNRNKNADNKQQNRGKKQEGSSDKTPQGQEQEQNQNQTRKTGEGQSRRRSRNNRSRGRGGKQGQESRNENQVDQNTTDSKSANQADSQVKSDAPSEKSKPRGGNRKPRQDRTNEQSAQPRESKGEAKDVVAESKPATTAEKATPQVANEPKAPEKRARQETAKEETVTRSEPPKTAATASSDKPAQSDKPKADTAAAAPKEASGKEQKPSAKASSDKPAQSGKPKADAAAAPKETSSKEKKPAAVTETSGNSESGNRTAAESKTPSEPPSTPGS